MKNSRGLLAVLSVITIVALAVGLFSYLHRADEEQVYVYNCGIVDYKPETLTKYCADKGAAIAYIQWDTWSAEGATGVGKYAINPCVPNCVSGKWEYADVKVKLTDSVLDKGKKVLSQIEVTTTDGKKLPLGVSASDNWALVTKPLK